MTFLAYETSADSSSPVELYRFVYGPTTWYFTSADEVYNYIINDYVPANLKRGKITQSNEGVRNDLNIATTIDFPIVELFRPGLPKNSVQLEIYRTHLQDPDQEVVLFWSGVVLKSEEQQFNATLICRPSLGLIKGQLLRPTFQRKCNHTIYDDFCTLNRTALETLQQVAGGSGTSLTVTGTFTDGDLIGGSLRNAVGDLVMITDNVGGAITLFNSLEGTDVGDSVRIAPGCQQSDVRCKALLNYDNYLGFKDVPNHDLHSVSGVKGDV